MTNEEKEVIEILKRSLEETESIWASRSWKGETRKWALNKIEELIEDIAQSIHKIYSKQLEEKDNRIKELEEIIKCEHAWEYIIKTQFSSDGIWECRKCHLYKYVENGITTYKLD